MRKSRSNPLLLVSVLVFCMLSIFLLQSCASSQSTTSTAVQTSGSTTEQTFTIEQLAQYNGQNGQKAYIAVDGVVYDVTDVAVWDSKQHAGKFTAGKDYTTELKTLAPHSDSVLKQAKKIGILVK